MSALMESEAQVPLALFQPDELGDICGRDLCVADTAVYAVFTRYAPVNPADTMSIVR